MQNGASGVTPMRTPMRDKLNINQMDDFESGSFEQVCATFTVQMYLFFLVMLKFSVHVYFKYGMFFTLFTGD